MNYRQVIRIAFVAATFSGELFAQHQLLWGDTHVHTSLSADAFSMGNRSATPETAYRFARGEPVIHPYHRSRIQIDKPLDFIVVADHAENLGVLSEIYFNGIQLGDEASITDRIKGWLTQRAIRKMLDERDFSREIKKMEHAPTDPRVAAERGETVTPDQIINGRVLAEKTWQTAIALADEYNAPGTFTTFIGWEWSSAPGGANLHRVVMTDADSKVAGQFVPFSSNDSPYPEDLWAWLEKTSNSTGAEFLAIPHNSNISKGFMFPEVSLRGEPIGEAYARDRMRWEPVVEVTQIKGDSETHPVFSPQDEFANFESYRYTFDVQSGPPKYSPERGDYARSGLRRGLELESRIGFNPYQFGMIGSTDTHTGLSTVSETNFGGKFALDSTPESKGPATHGQGVTGWSMSAQGLAAVWAETNTREAIMSAFKRREVYATTGPRIALQVFAGWNYEKDDLRKFADSDYIRSKGVPMGGELVSTQSGAAPGFLVRALKDPGEANLDRVQIVKGWINAQGDSQEKVFNISWSGERQLDEEGNIAPVGNTIDMATGRSENSIGQSALSAYWQDPEFNAAAMAFYYVRVLQIPTARHALLDALALGLTEPGDGDAIIQERAYSSPIWYRPRQPE